MQGRAHVPLGWTIAGGGNSFHIPLVGGAIMEMWNNGSATTVYGHADWQGSIRVDSTPSRTVNSDVAFAPFGEVYNSPTRWSYEFAGLANELASNLWDVDNRSYHANQGRWIRPDPAGSALTVSWGKKAFYKPGRRDRLIAFCISFPFFLYGAWLLLGVRLAK